MFSIEELGRLQVRYLQRCEVLSCQLQEFRVHEDVIDTSTLERVTPLVKVRWYDQCVRVLQPFADVWCGRGQAGNHRTRHVPFLVPTMLHQVREPVVCILLRIEADKQVIERLLLGLCLRLRPSVDENVEFRAP